jgi:hypothetical protein
MHAPADSAAPPAMTKTGSAPASRTRRAISRSETDPSATNGRTCAHSDVLRTSTRLGRYGPVRILRARPAMIGPVESTAKP